MTALLIIGLIFLGIGVIGAAVIILRRFPTLSVIEVPTISEIKTEQIKAQLISERLIRIFQSKAVAPRAFFISIGGLIQARFRKLFGKILALEKKYQAAAKASLDAVSREAKILSLLEMAAVDVKNKEFEAAETKYIEAISYNPKHIRAYEKLGHLYLHWKKLSQARETFEFLLKLSPSDASVLAALGEVAMAEGQPAVAVHYLEKAVQVRSKNPRYLDFLLEAYIMSGNRRQARETLAKLIAVNRENAKIHDFEERIKKMPRQ